MFRYKPAPPATEPVKLPETRSQMFRDVLKNQFSLVVNVSLLCSLFGLPLIGVYALGYRMLIAALAAENGVAQMFSTVVYLSALAIPCYSLWFLGLNGAFAVLKKRVWNQGCVIRGVFFASIKSGRSAAMGALVGCVTGLALIGSVYLLIFGEGGIQQGLGISICVILVLLFSSTAMYFLSGNNMYDLPFGGLFRNAFAFTWIGLIRNTGLNLLFIGLPLILIVLHPATAFIALFLIVMFLQGIAVLAWTLRCHSLFDKFINKEYYPEYVNMGLSTNNQTEGE